MKNVNNQVELIKKKLHDEAFLRSRGWKSLGLSSWAWDKAWPEPQLGLLLKTFQYKKESRVKPLIPSYIAYFIILGGSGSVQATALLELKKFLRVPILVDMKARRPYSS